MLFQENHISLPTCRIIVFFHNNLAQISIAVETNIFFSQEIYTNAMLTSYLLTCDKLNAKHFRNNS